MQRFADATGFLHDLRLACNAGFAMLLQKFHQLIESFLSDFWPGMVVYGFAFFAWGVTAGIIVHKQRRLAPMVIAHWIVNLVFGVGPTLAVGFAAL